MKPVVAHGSTFEQLLQTFVRKEENQRSLESNIPVSTNYNFQTLSIGDKDKRTKFCANVINKIETDNYVNKVFSVRKQLDNTGRGE